MKINENSLKDLTEIGIYKITNLKNFKVYVGSTITGFIHRYKSHYEKLRTNNHKGYPVLQNSVNKHGIENFEFEILEICSKDIILEREKYWIEFLNSIENGYNLNPNPTESLFANKDIRAKAAKTLKERYKSGKIKPNSGALKKGNVPWNKGLKIEDASYLKVPKRKKGSRQKFSETIKEKNISIDVFDSDMNFINSYRYYEDIKQDINLKKYMILRNKKGRNGHDAFLLQSVNILKSVKTGKSYKGLFFKQSSSLKIPLNGENPQ